MRSLHDHRCLQSLSNPTLLPLDPNRRQNETKLRNRQNQLGFVVGLAQQTARRSLELSKAQSKLNAVEVDLEKARLAKPNRRVRDWPIHESIIGRTPS